MKKIAFVLAAAGLMSVAACTKSPEAAAVENNADMLADNMEMQADNLEAVADNTSNSAAAAQSATSIKGVSGNGAVRNPSFTSSSFYVAVLTAIDGQATSTQRPSRALWAMASQTAIS